MQTFHSSSSAIIRASSNSPKGHSRKGPTASKYSAPETEIEARFLYLALQANPIEQRGYRRHFSTLKEKLIPFPSRETDEQRKIADCLSSLDDLIWAEEKVGEALLEHKRGLMQQLFPAPGETLPRLRFPKFRDDGPWVIKRMGEGITLVSGQHLGPSDYKTEPSDYPYFTGPSDFTDDNGSVGKWVQKEASPQLAVEGDVLVTVKGSGVGSLWRLKLPKVAMGRQLMAVRGTSFLPSFLHYFNLIKKAHIWQRWRLAT